LRTPSCPAASSSLPRPDIDRSKYELDADGHHKRRDPEPVYQPSEQPPVFEPAQDAAYEADNADLFSDADLAPVDP